MAKSRSSLISLSDTPYYHCIARCVRRGYLCGFDNVTKTCFDHRKVWLINRIKFLASVFCIDIAAYAIMSNHYHLVLRVNTDKAKLLSQAEVLNRWHQLCQPKAFIARCLGEKSAGKLPSKCEQMVIDHCIAEYRERLISISWFMRFLNEFIARQANVEDNCTGHFWEGRFKSQALLDEVAVLACMTYVDLNPIRANMANTPETSDFTSIQERLGIAPNMTETEQRQQTKPSAEDNSTQTDKLNQATLLPFVKFNQAVAPNFKRDANHIPFSLLDYVELVDWTGRQIRQNKRGFIQTQSPAIVQQLGLNDETWLEFANTIESHFSHSVGQAMQLQQYAITHQLKRVKGMVNPRAQA